MGSFFTSSDKARFYWTILIIIKSILISYNSQDEPKIVYRPSSNFNWSRIEKNDII